MPGPSSVTDQRIDPSPGAATRTRDVPAVGRELLGVRDQVQKGAIEPRPVAEDARSGLRGRVELDLWPALVGQRANGRDRGIGQLGRVELAELEAGSCPSG